MSAAVDRHATLEADPHSAEWAARSTPDGSPAWRPCEHGGYGYRRSRGNLHGHAIHLERQEVRHGRAPAEPWMEDTQQTGCPVPYP
jgi:hypothetical protein